MRFPLVGLALYAAGFLGASSSDAADAADGPPRLLVLPLQADAIQQNEAQRLGNTAREVARARSPSRVDSDASTTEIVEALVGMGLDCRMNEVACAVRIGQVSGASWVVVGAAHGSLVDHIGLELRLINVRAGKETRRVLGTVPREIEAQQLAAAELAGHLFTDSLLPTVAVASTPAGVDVVVDGVMQGVTPLAGPVAGLAPGEHIIELKKSGQLPRTERLHLSLGEHADLNVRLEVDPASLRAAPNESELSLPFWFAGGGAVVAVGGAVAVAVGCAPLVAYGDAKRAFDQAELDRKSSSYATRIADSRAGMEAASRDWESFGRTAVVAGSALIVVGASTAVATWLWGRAVEERAAEVGVVPAPTP